jgi:hypothetical protein
MLNYSVKIMGNRVERKGTTASEVPKAVLCSWNADFEVMVI